MHTIHPAKLAESLGRGEALQLICTLPAEFFQQLRIAGSGNACVYQVSFLEQVRATVADKTAPIVLYGSGPESRDAEVAAGKLQQAGYGNVRVLEGGIEAWRVAGLPLEGEAAAGHPDPATLLLLTPGSYDLDGERSSIGWTGRNAGTSHTGSVRCSAGTVLADATGFSGSLTVDMTSIANHNLAGDPLQAVLLDHLRSDDFFLVRLFPRADFTIRRGQLREKPFVTVVNCDISGELTLRGNSQPLAFPATVTVDGGELLLEAHFDLDRTDWGIVYGSARFFEHLGMHTVFDTVSIALRLVFTDWRQH